MTGIWRIILLCVLIIGCQPEPELEQSVAWGSRIAFDRPQAIQHVDDYLVVSNTGYDPAEWRPGSIVVINSDGQEVHRHTTSRLNPQRILVDEDYLYVINTGTYDFSDFARPKPASPGSIDRIRRDSLADPQLEVDSLDFSGMPQFASPVDGAILDSTLIVTSGLLTGFLKIDLKSFSVVGETVFWGDEDVIGLGAVTGWSGGFIISDFNADQLIFLDRNGEVICETYAGTQQGTIEGATAPRVFDDTLFVTLSLAGVLRSMPLDRDTLCTPALADTVSPLGQVPNDVIIEDEIIWIVHSGDNQITGFPRSDSGERVALLCPVGSNPWHMSLHPRRRELAVTEWKGNGVTLFDLEKGASRRLSNDSIP